MSLRIFDASERFLSPGTVGIVSHRGPDTPRDDGPKVCNGARCQAKVLDVARTGLDDRDA